MKKFFSYAIIYICLLFNLSSCDFLKSYRFEDITNHDFTDIDSITYSLGYDQPYSSTFNGNIYKYLNVNIIKYQKSIIKIWIIIRLILDIYLLFI